ncbi:MAG: heavy metal translocating P-type ATPase [Chloroflexi bacterium]|nr:heavy metal translocating P-type ATPase [Chloroflexota bacterium]MCL5274459.1 heavy metal translocating P-type ATPase [Chloroflexota bacterium]
MAEQKQTFHITGMDCADCARAIERGVAGLDGVVTCSLNYTAATLKVQGDTTRETIVSRVRELGYDIAGDEALAGEAVRMAGGALGFIRFLLARTNTALALAGALLILPGLLFVELGLWRGAPAWLTTVTSLGALAAAGYPVAGNAWRSLRVNHEVNINALMTIAAVGAVLIGATTEAGLVMALFAIGEALEGYTMEHTRNAIHSLMAVAPREATVLQACMDCKTHLGQNGYTGGPCPFCGVEEHRVSVDALRPGDTIITKPGERIAMDGRVTSGVSTVNQAPITGESIPVAKQTGDSVFAGSINGEGVLELTVLRSASDNTVSRIIRMVEEAQEKRAPAQRFVDQFARYYTPAVVAVAALVAVVPPLVFGAPLLNPAPGVQGWLYRALELLVVACPCALVISTPVSIVSAISSAARSGVLIKGGAYLEALSRVKAIAFDKTGTLTEGKPNVVRVRAVDCLTCERPDVACANCDDMLALASAIERRSEHPLARAVVHTAESNGVGDKYPTAVGVKAVAGKGVSGHVNGHSITVGSHAWFDSTVPHDTAQCQEIDGTSAQGQTPLLVSVDQQYRGYITVADTVRDTSRAAVMALKEAGVQTLVMLTGDNLATARHIAGQIGVTDVRAGLLPENKVEAIRALQDQYGAVAMVGDGINDAPALATASVGIAMGAGGTAQAMETADVVLMTDDLSRLPYAIRLSHAALATIKANIALSIAIKLLFLAVVLLGFGTMWLAVLADVGVSLVVTLNGMRLLGYNDIV